MLRKVPLLSFTDIAADELVKEVEIRTRHYHCIHCRKYQQITYYLDLNSCRTIKEVVTSEITDSRCQLAVVEQVLQRITTAEFILQTWQVTDDSRRVWGVNVARYIPHLHHRDVPISIETLSCRNLNTDRLKYVT